MYSPRWLFLYPGLWLVALGVVGYGLALPGHRIGRIHFDAHTLLFSSLAILLGHQSIVFAIFAKTVAMAEGLLPSNRRMDAFFRLVTLERGLSAGGLMLAGGLVLLAAAVNVWRVQAFGELDYTSTMRLVVPGVTLTALGFRRFSPASSSASCARRAADAAISQIAGAPKCRPSSSPAPPV